MATKTKEKIKDSLKNIFINELKGKKETERLERVKANSNLEEFTIYTDKNQPHNKQFTDKLTQEGISFIEKDITENKSEWTKVIATTNLGLLPTILVNKNFLVQRRDFQNPQQLLGAIQHFANPDFENPAFEGQVLEQMKTNNYNLFTRIQQLEGKLNPLITFITNLQKELAEEEKGE
tara:strand:- start:43 stop:576 length:534 start_codon:yes stop_codon:yes gene_type:complete